MPRRQRGRIAQSKHSLCIQREQTRTACDGFSTELWFLDGLRALPVSTTEGYPWHRECNACPRALGRGPIMANKQVPEATSKESQMRFTLAKLSDEDIRLRRPLLEAASVAARLALDPGSHELR